MNIIQGKGLKLAESAAEPKQNNVDFSNGFMKKLKEDADWFKKKGEELLESFMLPPLQVIAAAINFFTLLFTGNHLFEFPFQNQLL